VSGRPKNPVTDAEQLRLLTREAHEAIKGVREAIRDLRAEREAIERARAVHAAFLDESIRLAAGAAAEQIRDVGQLYTDQLQVSVNDVQEHVSSLLGSEDKNSLANAIVRDASQKLAELLRVEIDGDQVTLIPDGRRRRESFIRRVDEYRDAQVFVTTDPALAPPGSVIIDGR
jgi:hypothetical protein